MKGGYRVSGSSGGGKSCARCSLATTTSVAVKGSISLSPIAPDRLGRVLEVAERRLLRTRATRGLASSGDCTPFLLEDPRPGGAQRGPGSFLGAWSARASLRPSYMPFGARSLRSRICCKWAHICCWAASPAAACGAPVTSGPWGVPAAPPRPAAPCMCTWGGSHPLSHACRSSLRRRALSSGQRVPSPSGRVYPPGQVAKLPIR